ncbi:circular bacteriocin, circularin A/uberolysin family [Bacillus nakamurai]|uniref:circular bacteriocin, circularin A/uberolysin family n=1 Tax=Bacillus nakamurai TaxID=1793963 RepID=UPI0020C22445|nr:circular bacteriocin, circularin A/uberolysin family [Bacillus nakamurai]MCP6684052.1 circular bacteriocin, circularin A/uberolysin family [Bacillus nakamurai]
MLELFLQLFSHFELAKTLGVSAGVALGIVKLINAGSSIATVIALFAGVAGGLSYLYVLGVEFIKRKIIKLGIKATAAW